MKQTLSVTPTRKELLLGAVYLLLELFVLPYVLAAVNVRLETPLSTGEINAVFFVFNFGATTLIFRRFLKQTFLSARENLFQIIIAAIQGFGLYWAGNLLVAMLILRLDPGFINVNDASITAMASQDFLPIAICTVGLVPVAEELLFRGVLFAGFYNRSRVKAFLFSMLVFCAIHVTGYITQYPWDTLLLCFIQYIPASLALGWAYAKSGSILSPVLMHIAINAIGISVMR